VVDYPGHGDAFLDSGEPLRMIDVLLPSLIASPWRRKLWRPQPAQPAHRSSPFALSQRDAARLTCRTDQFGPAGSRPPKKERFGIWL